MLKSFDMSKSILLQKVLMYREKGRYGRIHTQIIIKNYLNLSQQ